MIVIKIIIIVLLIFIVPDSLSALGNLGISLSLNTSLPYQIRNIKYLLELELISYERFRQVYIRDIKDFFYQILLIKERVSLAKENLSLIQMQFDKTNLLYEAGHSSDLDLMLDKVNRANIHSEILSLENDYMSKLVQLKYLTGLNPEDELFLTGDINLPDDIFSVSVLTETYNYISTILDLEYLLGIEIINE
jgi:outer membrane protein TolC